MNAYTLYFIILGTRRLSYATGYTLFAIYLLRIVETTPLGLVMPGMIYELAVFLFEIPTGVVADVYSRRLSVIIGYLLMGVGLIVAGLYPALIVATIGLAFMGFGSTFVSGALSAWLVDEVGQEKASEAFLRGSQISTLANLAGIGLSILLGSVNLQLAVIGAGIPMIILAIILVFIMPESGFQPVPASKRESWHDLLATFRQGLTFVRESRTLLWIFIVVLIFAGFGETFGKLWQAHILENFTLPALADFDDIVWFGIISSVSIPVSLFATEIIRRKRINFKNGSVVISMLMVLFISLSAGTLLFVLSDNFMIALLGIWLTRIILAMIEPLMNIWLNQHIDSQIRATVLSIVGQVNSFGEIIIGGPIAGGLATMLSIRVAIVVVTLFLAPLTWIFRLVSKVQYMDPSFAGQQNPLANR